MRRACDDAGAATDDATPLLGRGNLANVLAATSRGARRGVPLARSPRVALRPADRRGAVDVRGGVA